MSKILKGITYGECALIKQLLELKRGSLEDAYLIGELSVKKFGLTDEEKILIGWEQKLVQSPEGTRTVQSWTDESWARDIELSGTQFDLVKSVIELKTNWSVAEAAKIKNVHDQIKGFDASELKEE